MKDLFLFYVQLLCRLHARIAIAIFIILIAATGLQAQTEIVWESEFPTVGVYSSLRSADLNQDGIRDLIVGAGRLEFQATDSSVIAVSGANGETLWVVPARDQIFGSAGLLDITGDGIKDVIIGGRSATLFAIEGRTGEVIWEFFTEYAADTSLIAGVYGFYNFYNPQFIPDQTGDGLDDILISNGGDVLAPSGDPDRPPGKLMVIDSSNGKLIVHAEVPDKKETYMSHVITRMHEDDEDLTVIFGTGGETISGNLYRTTLGDIMNGDISNATILAESSQEKGFIAPPVLVDLTRNETFDIVANAVEGRMIAISGTDNSLLWDVKIDGVEGYSSPAVGYFTNDSIPDFFTTYGVGVWPEIEDSKQILVSGSSGEILYRESLGLNQTSSPVVYDLTGDGYDNAILSANFTVTILEEGILEMFHNMLVLFDFRNETWYPLNDYLPGMNISSTPWVGDLDDNGELDIVYCTLTQAGMSGFKMVRLRTGIEMDIDIKWGAYMGSDYDGIFPVRKDNNVPY